MMPWLRVKSRENPYKEAHANLVYMNGEMFARRVYKWMYVCIYARACVCMSVCVRAFVNNGPIGEWIDIVESTGFLRKTRNMAGTARKWSLYANPWIHVTSFLIKFRDETVAAMAKRQWGHNRNIQYSQHAYPPLNRLTSSVYKKSINN